MLYTHSQKCLLPRAQWPVALRCSTRSIAEIRAWMTAKGCLQNVVWNAQHCLSTGWELKLRWWMIFGFIFICMKPC